MATRHPKVPNEWNVDSATRTIDITQPMHEANVVLTRQDTGRHVQASATGYDQ